MKTAAANSVFGMQDAADATLNFSRQGFQAAEAADMLTPALDLAAGTATDLSSVTSGLGNALKMFGKSSDYASTAADILSKAQSQANTTVTDLFDAMSVAGRSVTPLDGRCLIWLRSRIYSETPLFQVQKVRQH